MRVTLDANLRVHDPGPHLRRLCAMARWQSTAGMVRRVVRLWRWDEVAGTLTLPRGLWPLPPDMGPFEVEDNRLALPEVSFGWRGPTLDDFQKRAASNLYGNRAGMLVAPGGVGKTLMALRVVAAWKQPALWVVHSTSLALRALAVAKTVYRLPESGFGTIMDGEYRPGTHFTVGLRQTLITAGRRRDCSQRFGSILCDELDLTASSSYIRVLCRFPAFNRAGCTATPERADNLHPVVSALFGRQRVRISEAEAEAAGRFVRPRLVARQTHRRYVWAGNYPALQEERAKDPERNRLIAMDVARELRRQHACLVLVQRVDHAKLMVAALRSVGVRPLLATGNVKPEVREHAFDSICRNGGCLVATKIVDRGVDMPAVDRVFLADSYRAAPTVEQQVYRVTRVDAGKRDAVVYDYWDDCAQFRSQAEARRRLFVSKGWRVDGA